ncbi:hypothetical protein PFDSM3638_00690 [Pyrococcus furiosus DSM 3638]|uniref:Uncharacterized protein n=3 Tax=Pyrococcus furiosus TaxID=2261 RepID=A0A5C0XT21_PYRFU|nr:hypothetical protein [Pyrococcus furiosus]AAL80274.1 hypothetical protein PF0150 [Pyrococcus furiosus DSM 3638]AFN04426.1 hypothetical protein PFC_07450 [Pyrococcus furiosus COM1]QEK77880.1 hypothetical protein PFDSM3638_00690 [Pyrococcus furiosus DSM 3638]
MKAVELLELEARKFEERANILENHLVRLQSSLVKKYEDRLKLRHGYSPYIILVVLVTQIIIIVFLQERFGFLILRRMLYGLAGILLLIVLVMIILGHLNSEEDEEVSIMERINSYRKVAKLYKRIGEAITSNNLKEVQRIADELLENVELARAVEIAGVGDPKIIAYVLYAYLNKDILSKEEIEEAITVAPRPLGYLLREGEEE